MTCEPPDLSPDQPLDQSGSGPVRVVVVDDHPVVRDGLVAMLQASGEIEVVGEAADGEAALRVVTRAVPDVVLMDLQMPRMGGVAAIRALRVRDPARPRILVLTTYDTDREFRRAIQAGADGLLLKDAQGADLVRAVHELVRGYSVLARPARTALSERPAAVELTPREREVLRWVADGCTNRAAARRLGIGEATVKTHLGHIYEKLGVVDRASAVRAAWEHGLV